MRSDHLSKHIKTHAKPGENAENELADDKDFALHPNNDDVPGDLTENMEEFDSEDESGSDVSDSEIAPSNPPSLMSISNV